MESSLPSRERVKLSAGLGKEQEETKYLFSLCNTVTTLVKGSCKTPGMGAYSLPSYKKKGKMGRELGGRGGLLK